MHFWNRTEGNNFHHCNTTKTGSTRLMIILQDTPSLPPACSHIWCLNINSLQTKIESRLCSNAVKTWKRRGGGGPSPVTMLVSDHISLQSHAVLMREAGEGWCHSFHWRDQKKVLFNSTVRDLPDNCELCFYKPAAPMMHSDTASGTCKICAERRRNNNMVLFSHLIWYDSNL